MSSFGSWQCTSGFSPGTSGLSSSVVATMSLPKMLDRAVTDVASRAGARSERNFMLLYVLL